MKQIHMNKKLISGCLSLFLILGKATSVMADTTKEDLIQNKSHRQNLESTINEQEKKIFALNDEINTINVEIENNSNLILELSDSIEQTKLKIEDAKKRMDDTEELYESKMRQLYKNGGQADYLSILLDADSLGDFLSRISIITRLLAIDSQIITSYKEQGIQLEVLLTKLHKEVDKAEGLRKENEEKLASLELRKQEQAAYISGLEKELSELNALIATQEYKLAEEERIAEAQRKAEEERIAKESGQIIDYSNGPSRGDYPESNNKRSLGVFKLTAYCPCSICTGKYSNGITSTGTKAAANRTIAVDPRVIPYGSTVEINGKSYKAEDTGSAIKKYKIDIYFNTHREALQFGVRYAEVFLYN